MIDAPLHTSTQHEKSREIKKSVTLKGITATKGAQDAIIVAGGAIKE